MTRRGVTFLISVAVFLCIAIALWAFWDTHGTPFTQKTTSPETMTLTGGKSPILAEVVRTQEAQERGLSGRKSLAEGKGMLFVFSTPGLYPFWMPDMHFPIDIIWLNNDLKVVTIAENVSPDTYPRTFSATTPATYVLELPAGSALQSGIATGTVLHVENTEHTGV